MSSVMAQSVCRLRPAPGFTWNLSTVSEETLLLTVNKQLLAKQKCSWCSETCLDWLLSCLWCLILEKRQEIKRSCAVPILKVCFVLFVLFWLYLPRIEAMFCGCRADIFPCVGDFNREQLASVTLNVMFSSNWQRIKLISVLNGFEVQYKYWCFVALTL